MRFHNFLQEAAYAGNVGFEEMILFFQKANINDIDQMNKIVQKEDWNAFKKLVKKVLGMRLK